MIDKIVAFGIGFMLTSIWLMTIDIRVSMDKNEEHMGNVIKILHYEMSELNKRNK